MSADVLTRHDRESSGRTDDRVGQIHACASGSSAAFPVMFAEPGGKPWNAPPTSCSCTACRRAPLDALHLARLRESLYRCPKSGVRTVRDRSPGTSAERSVPSPWWLLQSAVKAGLQLDNEPAGRTSAGPLTVPKRAFPSGERGWQASRRPPRISTTLRPRCLPPFNSQSLVQAHRIPIESQRSSCYSSL